MTQPPIDQEYQPSSYYHWLQEDSLAAPCHAAGCSFDNLLVLSNQQNPLGVSTAAQPCPVTCPLQERKPSRSEVEDVSVNTSPAIMPLAGQLPLPAAGARNKDCDGYHNTTYYSLHHFQPEAPQQNAGAALY